MSSPNACHIPAVIKSSICNFFNIGFFNLGQFLWPKYLSWHPFTENCHTSLYNEGKGIERERERERATFTPSKTTGKISDLGVSVPKFLDRKQ
jgi:hypothetical protein